MTSQVVDKLVMELELELGRFRSQTAEAERVNEKLKSSLKGSEEAGDKAAQGSKKLGNETERTKKKTDDANKSVLALVKGVVGLFAAITGGNVILKFSNSIAAANDQLLFLQKRLDMGAQSIVKMSNAAAALGGDAGAMQNTIKSLNQSIQELVIMGDSSMLPFFNALGVGVVDASGKVRDMDDIMLDMADSLSKMDPRQAYAIASAMGLDDGVANALIQGRDAMQEMIGLQSTLYVSTQAELEASRELRKQQSLLGAYWEGMKTMLGNALIPLLLKLTQGAQGFVEYLMRNERTVKNVFEGLAYVIGVVLTVGLYKAVTAMGALLAPFGAVAAAVLALSAAFIALYDDYKTWAEGGKSLLDWSTFDNYIKNAKVSVDSLATAFVRLLTGYNSWGDALEGFKSWATLKGFIEENGVSVNSLAAGFRSLAGDILRSIPILSTFIGIIDKVISGDFSGAISIAKEIPSSAFESWKNVVGGSVQHFAGAVDTAAGMDPRADNTLSGFIRGVRGKSSDIDQILRDEEKRTGLPEGILKSIMIQETGGDQSYVDDPTKYHYEPDSSGRRVAPHTGKVSTAFGPFGLLESTASNPGGGVSPLKDKSFLEQARFAADYAAYRIATAGSLEGGLAGYGEGSGYAQSVMGRMDVSTGRDFVRSSPSVQTSSSQTSSSRTDVNIQLGGVTVNTSADTLPQITAEALGASLDKSSDMLNQIGAGM